MQITLPFDGDRRFHINKLIDHLNSQKRSGIVIGQQHQTLENHSKKNSLDYWIRKNVAANQDVAQATQEVVNQLCATEFFNQEQIPCLDSDRQCAGIVLEHSLANLIFNHAEAHFQRFKECVSANGPAESWVGSDVVSWWSWVAARLDMQNTEVDLSHAIFEKPLTRTELKELCANQGITDATCAAAILAWGGQRRDHGVTTFNQFDKIQPIISRMRSRKVTPLKAYSEFHELWENNEIKGLGAAYFTKLIFFCELSHTGYIMDQWTSKSVNLITGERFINVTVAGHVTKNNMSDTYRRFLSTVDQLGLLIGICGEEVEIGMFSMGGHNPLPWRKYVVSTY